MLDSYYSSGIPEETTGAFGSPFHWSTANQVGMPCLRDQVLIATANEFDFWQSSDWLMPVVEATLTRLQNTLNPPA